MTRSQNPFCEYFIGQEEYTLASVPRDGVFYDFQLSPDAIVDSEFIITEPGLGVIPPLGLEGKKRFPACIRYENKSGMRFMIYSFLPETVATTNEWIPGIFRNYCRQKQLGDGYRWLCGHPLPAMCYGAPQLYILCKKDTSNMAVGLWNLFADRIPNPVIELDAAYARLDCYHCSGRLDGTRVLLNDEIPPYGFAFFTVYHTS